LALGGDGFRDAAAGIDESLIATEDAMAASREYEVAMDDLQDTVTGLKYELGNGLIPILVDLLGSVNDVTSRVTSEEAAWGKLKKAHENRLITQGELTEAYLKLSTGLWDAEDATNYLTTATDKLEAAFSDGSDEAGRYKRIFGDLDEMVAALAVTFDTELASAVSDAREDMGAMTDNEIAAQIIGLAGLKKAAEEYSTALSSVTTSGLQQFTDGIGELMRRQALLTYWQTDKSNPALADAALKTYQASLANSSLIGNIEALNAAQLIGTVTELEWNAAMADGIVTNEELEAAIAPTSEQALALATNVGLAHAALHDMDGTTADTYIYHHDITEYTEVRPPGYKGKWAAGTDFIIPPGYNDDNYPLGFGQSGERVVVIPKGQVTNNNSFNMNVHTNAQTSSVMGDFNKMKAWAG